MATRVLFTEVTRNLEQIVGAASGRLTVEHDAPALFGGLFRMVVLRKPDPHPAPAASIERSQA